MMVLTVACQLFVFSATLSTRSFFVIVAISLSSDEILLKLSGTVYAEDCIESNGLSRRAFGWIEVKAIRFFSRRIAPFASVDQYNPEAHYLPILKKCASDN